VTQFALYRNRNPQTKADYPLLLDVQHALFEGLQTRVVIPLTKAAVLAKFPLDYLTPPLRVGGETYLLMTPQLAGIDRADLGPEAGDVVDQRQAVLSALEFLAHGSF
jgi:toxin CcdB